MLIVEGKNYSIASECRRSQIPERFWGLAFSKIVLKILNKEAFVSIVFVRESKMKALNQKYRKINKSTDVLSFNLEDGGEIFFSINNIRRKAKDYGLEIPDYLSLLLIHALLHLKGYRHSSKMDSQEEKLCRLFKINVQQNHSGNRHRHLPSTSSGRGKPRTKRAS